jgi:PPIC-type PPIASE domain
VIRRWSILVALGAVGLAGCGTFGDNDAAASVDGTEISRDDFEDTLTVLAANSESTGIEEDTATGSVPGDTGRSVLNVLVTATASEQYLAAAGEAVSDAERDAVDSSLAADSPLRGLPDDVFELVVNLQAAGAARGRVAAAADAEAGYEASPADLGVMCVRHIVVEDEEAATEVLAELDDGADFAELAAERSIEQSAAQTGGALANPQTGEPCLTIAEAEASFDPAFVAGARDAIPGQPTEPVESSFGWHVILARPFDEVEESVVAIHGSQLFADYLAEANIHVDPRYGRWDAESGQVVGLA